MRFGLSALACAFVALLAWVAAPGPSFLDALVAVGFCVGGLLGMQGTRRGSSPMARRTAVIALGLNGAGLLLLALLYLAG